jgi:hemoglobin/transferrin/lactoferrin receptor protein
MSIIYQCLNYLIKPGFFALNLSVNLISSCGLSLNNQITMLQLFFLYKLTGLFVHQKHIGKRIRRLLLSVALIFPTVILAEDNIPPPINTNNNLPETSTSSSEISGEIEVLEKLIIEEEYIVNPFDSTKSNSVISKEKMERRQSSNVMEVLQDIPGVSIEGGPRASGMKISIRGFDNNEDVLIKIDGATQNFEKYRYGIGLSIDPELLKRVEVSRGAASLTKGSGALGGVIEMETIDARDLLNPDEMFGFRAKYGHKFNNDADHLTLTAMASPTDFLDILVSGVKRESNDFKIPDGTRYPDSEESQLSGLAKLELYTDAIETSFSYRFSDETKSEPFDATGAFEAVGKTVLRTTEEKSYTFNSRFQPETEWLDIKASVGYTDKMLRDDDSVIAGESATPGKNGTDIFQYDIWTAELKNQAAFELFGSRNSFTLGAQFNQEARDSIRINKLGTNSNPAQPPGLKKSYGVFLEHQVFIGDLTLGAGVRGDYYQISAGDGSKQLLEVQNRATTTDFTQLKPSFSIDYNVLGGPFTLFYSYFEAFRAPLIDEYFANTVTRCKTFSMFKPLPILPVREDFPPGIAGTLAWLNAVNQFPAELAVAKQNPYAQSNALCGDLYEPEQSINHEAGISFIYDGILDDSDRFSSKFTFFYTRVDNILESIYQNTASGKISQPGVEVHHGFEVELNYDSESYFGSLSLSTLDGYRSLNYFENNSNPAIAEATTSADQGKEELYDSPADKLIFTIGRKFNSYNFEIGYRLEAFNDRLITVGLKSAPGCSGGIFVVPSCNEVGKQKGYILHDLFATWRPWKRTELRLNIDNFTNATYKLSGFGGGEGAIAPGMDIRLSFSQQF